MEYFDDLILGLSSHWGQKLRSILIDSTGSHPSSWNIGQQVEAFGQVFAIDDGIWCTPAFFQPFKGVDTLKFDKSFQLVDEIKSSQFPIGSWIGFNNVEVKQINEENIKLNAGIASNIWILSERLTGFPINFTNVFCGAFCGWERSIQWLQAKRLIHVQRTISIDICEQTMKIWQMRTKASVATSIEQIRNQDHAQTLGIQIAAGNDQWLSAIKAQSNNVFTGSPPCQPWCKGGTHGGLQCDNGIAFIEFIQKAKQARPTVVCVECADSTPQHEHFALLRKCFEYAGFRFYWSDIVQYENLSSMWRTRWLAVWIRNDLQVDGFRGRFRLFDVQKKGWNDDTYCFAVPSQIQHQLILKTDLSSIYGDFDLLPQSKRSAVGDKKSVDAVLQARCIRSDQCLPTLVASYTQQHNLAKHHLIAKGIYAFLVQMPNGFAFVDPFRFASLLGAVCGEIIPLPVKIEYNSFKNLGNAISIPQALLTILVGLSAVKFISGNIMSIIQECWKDRVTTHNSIVCRNQDFAFIVPHALVAKTIAEFCIRECIPQTIPHVVVENCKFPIAEVETIGKFLQRCGIDVQSQKGLFCMHDITQIPWSFNMKSIVGQECILLNKYHTVFRFTVVEHACTEEIYECDSLDHDIEDVINNLEAEKHVADQIDATIPYDIQQSEDDQKQSFYNCEEQPGQTNIHSTDLDLYEVTHWNHFRNCIDKIDDIAHKVVFTDGRRTLSFCAIAKLPCDSVAARLPFFDPECHEQFDVHEVKSLARDRSCVFVANPKNNAAIVGTPIVFHDLNNNQCIAKCVCSSEIPWSIVARDFPTVSTIKINEGYCNPFIKTCFSPGDLISIECKKRKQIPDTDGKVSIGRTQRFLTDGSSLATDEFKWVLEKLAQFSCNCVLLQATNIDGTIANIINTKVDHRVGTVILPILHDGHWCAVEIQQGTKPRIIGLNFRNDDKNRLVQGLQQVGFDGPPVEFAKSPVQNGFCGWILVHRWCHKHPFANTLQNLPQLEQLTGLKAFEVIGSCPEKGPDVLVWSFAARIRLSFLRWHVNKQIATDIEIGSAPDATDVKMTQDASDPIFENDPWAPPKDRKMCKWEDLKMPNDHYFRFKDGEQIAQMHRQQLNNNVIGIAFGTKAHVVDLFTSVSSAKVGLLIPASDKPKFDQLPKISITGPFEVVVQDSALGTIYKRQVLLIQHGSEIDFKLPKASYSANPPALTELVLEIDERIISKEVTAQLIDKPLDFFKRKFIEQLPSVESKQLHMYAFRTIKAEFNKVSHRIFQTMTKIASDKRAMCIERSGVGELFIRDFIPKGTTVDDVTTLPRFWNPDKSGQADALKASSNVEGYAGLTLTRRGVAVRAWCAKIAPMRTAILADDDRVCQLNLGTVPRVTVESTGWPASIGPSEVVKAVFHEVKAAPIPTRCYKSLGVTTWSLAFETKPAVTRFLCQLNGISHEIILTPTCDKQIPQESKGGGKGKSKTKSDAPLSNPVVRQPVDSADPSVDSRLTALEVKFGSLERRQDSLESRITDGFCSVQDQLRQVLNVIQPRPAHEHTGATPPSKLQKIGG